MPKTSFLAQNFIPKHFPGFQAKNSYVQFLETPHLKTTAATPWRINVAKILPKFVK